MPTTTPPPPITLPIPLYQRLLGDAWAALPPALMVMHGGSGVTATGVAQVERGGGLLSRLTAALVGFPAAGRDVALAVHFQAHDGAGGKGELWQRTFAGKSFSSLQTAGYRRAENLLSERFGPFTFGLALMLKDDKLHLITRRWNFLGLPLPMALAPGGEAYEFVDNGRFCFHVEINHALTGLIVRYRGWLAPGFGAAGTGPG
jgi:hypothetical protein